VASWGRERRRAEWRRIDLGFVVGLAAGTGMPNGPAHGPFFCDSFFSIHELLSRRTIPRWNRAGGSCARFCKLDGLLCLVS